MLGIYSWESQHKANNVEQYFSAYELLNNAESLVTEGPA